MPGEWEWVIPSDPESGEFGTFFSDGNRISLPVEGSTSIGGIRVVLNNSFAPMPVIGYTYSSAQFIGRGPTEFSIRIDGVGSYHLSRIEEMVEELEYNARNFRKVKGSSYVRFDDNPLLKIFGIEDGSVAHVNAETDPRGTDAYNMTIAFTSTGHHQEALSQEMYQDSEIWGNIIEVLLQHIDIDNELSLAEHRERTETQGLTRAQNDLTANVIDSIGELPRSLGQAISPNNEWGQAFTRVGLDLALAGGNPTTLLTNLATGDISLLATHAIEHTGGEVYRTLNDFVRTAVGPDANLETPEDLINAVEAFHSAAVLRLNDAAHGGSINPFNAEAIARSANAEFLNRPVRTPWNDNAIVGSYTYRPMEDHDWVNNYLREIVSILTQHVDNLPPSTFFRGTQRGAYQDYSNRLGLGRERDNSGGITPDDEMFNAWPSMFRDPNSELNKLVTGTRTSWRGTGGPSDRNVELTIVQSMNNLVSDLRLAVRGLLREQGREDFQEVFPDLVQQLVSQDALTSNPTYQDLDLPPHPATGLEIDTNPDFYFYNDGEEGLLNEIGPDLIQSTNDTLRNIEASMARMSAGANFNEEYLGRNRMAQFRNPLPDGESMSENEPRVLMDGDPSIALQIDNDTLADDNSSNFARMSLTAGTDTVLDKVLDSTTTVRSSSNSEAHANLMSRRADMLRSSTYSFIGQPPEGPLGIGPIDRALNSGHRRNTFNREFIQETLYESILQNPENTLTMRRAFPTFKLYFLEDDTGVQRRYMLPAAGSGRFINPVSVMYMDDFYSYNSVKSIRLVRSRKSPSDLLVLELTNVTGLLERRRWTAENLPYEYPTEIYAPGFEGTELENPLKKLVLKDGLKVQLKLGYENSPLDMNTKFNGEIVEFSYTGEISDSVTIICQSYGNELLLDRKGMVDGDRTTFRDTVELLHTMMCSPELVHFGRFDLNPNFNPAEARTAATSRDEQSLELPFGLILRNPRDISDGLRGLIAQNRSRWLIGNNPADDNIFAPPLNDFLEGETTLFLPQRHAEILAGAARWSSEVLLGVQSTITSAMTLGISNSTWLGAWGWQGHFYSWIASMLGVADYTVRGQTIWEIVKECELRHPGWIGHPRPYGTRQTLFFGVPTFKYWADSISQRELMVLHSLEGSIDRMITSANEQERRQAFGQLLNRTSHPAAGREADASGSIRSADLGVEEAINDARTSARHSTINRYIVRLQREISKNRYLRDAGDRLSRTLGRFRQFQRNHLITDKHHILLNNIRASEKGVFNKVILRYDGGSSLYSLKVDDSIPDYKTRAQVFEYESCEGTVLARRYCIGLLMRHLKDVYKGELVVTGMDVDPYDDVFLSDERSGMQGAFEVEQVVDTFTPETGWVTEITPDLVVHANEWSTIGTKAARARIKGELLNRYNLEWINGVGGLLFMGAAAPIAVPTWIGAYYVTRYTQDRQPIIISPLVLGNRILVAGVDGMREDGIIASLQGQFVSSVDNVRHGYRQFNLVAFLNDVAITRTMRAAGQI